MNTLKSINVRLLALLALFLLTTGQSAQAADRKLTFAVAGVVASINVKPGQSVKAGTVLAVLDQTPFLARKKSADTAAKSARLILDLAEIKAEQTRELFDALSTSQEEVDKAETSLAKAEAAFEKARSAAVVAEWELERASLRSPFSGSVSSIPGYPGQVINLNAGSPTVVVVNGG